MHSEVELFGDDNVQFFLELECAYSSRFEPPFLKESHQMRVVQSDDYETWYTGYMQAIRRWSNCPTEFFSRFSYLSAHHQICVQLYIQCLADVFENHKFIHAPTRINPVDCFGETMFRYTLARLPENERTRCLLIDAYICVHLSHFRDEAYTHNTNHGPHFREFARLIEGDWENRLKQYNADTAVLFLDKRHEEECMEKVAERDATIFAALDRCHLLPNPTHKKLNVDVLKGAIKAIKASSTFQYAGPRVRGNRASLFDQIEAVMELCEA